MNPIFGFWLPCSLATPSALVPACLRLPGRLLIFHVGTGIIVPSRLGYLPVATTTARLQYVLISFHVIINDSFSTSFRHLRALSVAFHYLLCGSSFYYRVLWPVLLLLYTLGIPSNCEGLSPEVIARRNLDSFKSVAIELSRITLWEL